VAGESKTIPDITLIVSPAPLKAEPKPFPVVPPKSVPDTVPLKTVTTHCPALAEVKPSIFTHTKILLVENFGVIEAVKLVVTNEAEVVLTGVCVVA
jgi:hypothetical protein